MHQAKAQFVESDKGGLCQSATELVVAIPKQAALPAFRLFPFSLLIVLIFAANCWSLQSTANPGVEPTHSPQKGEIADNAKAAPTASERLQKPLPPAVAYELKPGDQLLSVNPQDLTSQAKVSSTIQLLLSIGVLSLAPALILMSTSFVRIVIVMGILRQALGAQQLPPTQVIMALSLFMTFLIMAPVFNEVKREALDPYTSSEQSIDWDTAWERGTKPVKRFMSRQIDTADNSDDIWLFFQYLPEEERKQVPQTYEEVPLKVLLPAFLISELKIAFIIGVQIYLPFLILDIVISSVTVSMGMMMLPPTVISLPFKLLLFVMVDGWTLIVGMLLESFAPYT